MNSEGKNVIVCCSGASNTGTTADKIARKLCIERPDSNELLCLSALSIGKMLSFEKLKQAKMIVVIEGCPSRCASELLRQKGFSPTLVVEMVGDYGIKKNMTLMHVEEDVERICHDLQGKMVVGG